MGGTGSGGYNGRHSPKVESCLQLSINKLVQDESISPRQRTWGSWSWRGYFGESRVSYEANAHDPDNAFLHLRYSLDGESMDYKIRLVRTRPNYGGWRWWFICPSTGRRVGKLYLPYGGSIFASRKAYRLKYTSQGMDPYGRAMRKSQKLQDKIEQDDDMYLRPKGMHQKTFDRIVDAIEDAEAKVDRRFAIIASRFLDKLK